MQYVIGHLFFTMEKEKKLRLTQCAKAAG